jgi:glyoxylase-like metal-dependent hydrolase (beta-lactamase superfamily II)
MHSFKDGNLTFTIYRADERSLGAASTLISGDTEAVLVDAQLTVSHAAKVADMAARSGKRLAAIFVSNGDPECYLGLSVLKSRFPDVRILAAPGSIVRILQTSQERMAFWKDRLGDEISGELIVPEVLVTGSLEFDGYRFEVRGSDSGSERTFVWQPELSLVFGGRTVTGTSFHPWIADASNLDEFDDWIETLDAISTLRPRKVIPGHGTFADEVLPVTLSHTKNYLLAYRNELRRSLTADDLITALRNRFPDLGLDLAVRLGARKVFSDE